MFSKDDHNAVFHSIWSYNVTLTLLPLRDEVYVSRLWKWVGFCNCFDKRIQNWEQYPKATSLKAQQLPSWLKHTPWSLELPSKQPNYPTLSCHEKTHTRSYREFLGLHEKINAQSASHCSGSNHHPFATTRKILSQSTQLSPSQIPIQKNHGM